MVGTPMHAGLVVMVIIHILLLVEVENLMAYSRTDGITLARLYCHDITRTRLNVTTSDSMFTIDVEIAANRTYWIDNKQKVLELSFITNSQLIILSF